MSRVSDIDRYLRAYFASQQTPGTAEFEPHARPFVTISRQAGIGGHALADTLVEVFSSIDDSIFEGWRVYDRTLCEMVAEDPRYRKNLDSLLEEEYRAKTNDFFHQMLRSTVDQKLVMNRVFLAVRTVAGIGKAVIVGRAGAQVTKDMPEGVSIRVIAPEDARIARVVETHGLTEREARDGGRKRDADMARLIKAQFATDIDDPADYDAVFNAGEVSFGEIARSVAIMMRSRSKAI